MLIKLSEILEGDEIIISGNSKLKYLKVLKKPELGDRFLWIKYIDNNGQFKYDTTSQKRYKSVRCSTF